PALPLPDLNPALAGDAIHHQKAKIMRRELILESGISQTNNQFHATIPSHAETADVSSAHVATAASAVQPSEARRLPLTALFLLLLLGLLFALLRLLGRSRLAFSFGLRLALLDDLGLGRSRSRL